MILLQDGFKNFNVNTQHNCNVIATLMVQCERAFKHNVPVKKKNTDTTKCKQSPDYNTSLLRHSMNWQILIQHVQSAKTSADRCQQTLTEGKHWSNKTQQGLLPLVRVCQLDRR